MFFFKCPWDALFLLKKKVGNNNVFKNKSICAVETNHELLLIIIHQFIVIYQGEASLSFNDLIFLFFAGFKKYELYSRVVKIKALTFFFKHSHVNMTVYKQ